MPTTVTSNDGVLEYWSTRPDGSTSKQINEQTGAWYGRAHPNSAGGNYMNGGYLLGSSNSGFDEETIFYIDDVVVSSTNLWNVR